jgi:hypothetical protein
MFGDALKEVAGAFDRRFLMHIFVPVVFFWALLIVIWIAGRGNLSATLMSWNGQDALPKTIQILCFLTWVYLFSSVVNGNLLSILRAYEGYWQFPGSGYLKDVGTRWHQKTLNELYAIEDKNPAAHRRIYYFYPRPSKRNNVMPTSLGNILKSAEMYPFSRYKIDSVLIWPRLYRLFPQTFIEDVLLVRRNLDFMLVITSLSIAFALITGVYLFIARADWWLFLLCFWGGLIVAWISYRSALSTAVSVGIHIRVAFDLYREELLKQMRIPLPPNQAAEKITWDQVCKFLYRRGAITSAYQDTTSAPQQDPAT